MSENLPSVAGRRIRGSNADFERACLVHIDRLQGGLGDYDSALLDTLCEAVRLVREYSDAMAVKNTGQKEGSILSRLDSLPPAPWRVDTGTMANTMLGCWLVCSDNRDEYPGWLLATSGHKDAKEIAECVCLMRNFFSSLSQAVGSGLPPEQAVSCAGREDNGK